MKTVDEVTLVAGQELPPPPGVPDGTWKVFICPPTGLLGYGEEISVLGEIIASQIGSAMNRPDRVYRPFSFMPAGSSIEIDDDPLSPNFGNACILQDPYLSGLEYNVHRRGVEILVKGDEWQNDILGGGIRLTEVGAQFELGDVITVSFQPQISGVISTPDAVARFTLGEQVITADTIAGPANDRKLIMIQGATADAVTYTLRSGYPENVLCPIVTGGGNNKQSIILAPAGQSITRGQLLTRLILGEIDHAFLIRNGNNWRVVNCGDRWKRVGHVSYGGLPGPDVISANGQVLQRSSWPGIDDYLDALNTALPGSVITVSQWNQLDGSQKGKWARDATTIIVPKLQGKYIRGLDLGAGVDPRRSGANAAKGQIAGDQAQGSLLSHNHIDPTKPDFKKLVSGTTGGNNTAATFVPGGRPPQWIRVDDSADIKDVGGSENSVTDTGLPVLICV